MIAAGVGCRRACSVEDVLAAIAAALSAARRSLTEVEALYAPELKRAEPCLRAAADRLQKRLVFLGVDALQAQSDGALTVSPRVLERFALPSVSETAALAGASSAATGRARLLGPRQVSGGATCALASAKVAP